MSDIFREGWTERIIYALSHDNEELNLSGMSVALVGQRTVRGGGSELAFLGSVGIVQAGNGTVYFDPHATDLSVEFSPYLVRWKVTDQASKVAYFPRGAPITWDVRNP